MTRFVVLLLAISTLSGCANSAAQSQDITKLIVRTSMKDRAAFDLLYRQTSAKLFGVCLRVLNDRGDAEEANSRRSIAALTEAGGSTAA